MNNDIPGAQRIVDGPSILVKKGENGLTWNFPQREIRLGGEWYMKKYEALSGAPEGSLVIDAGCKEANWIGQVHGIIPPYAVRIAIDPIDYGVLNARGGPTEFNPHGGDHVYHHYCRCAIDDVDEPTEAVFNIFDEPGCNSLLTKSEHLKRNSLGTQTVPVMTLESIILGLGIQPGTKVQYLKCDCQGKDVAVARSLRSFLGNTEYVQIEASFSKEQPFYVGQPSLQEDVAEMRRLGFRPIAYMQYGGSPLPEGEVLFQKERG